MEQDPIITVNWERGDADFHLGKRLKRLGDPVLKVDLLSDIANDAARELEIAEEELHPGLAESRQRARNTVRRHWANAIVGSTVDATECLQNGDLALILGDGRVIVVAAAPSVDIIAFDTIEKVRECVGKADGTRYTDLVTDADRAILGDHKAFAFRDQLGRD